MKTTNKTKQKICDKYLNISTKRILRRSMMKAGFAIAKINPLVGMPLEGLGVQGGSTAIHDDLFARALYLEDKQQSVFIIGSDLLFFERNQINRFKGAICRQLNITPAQILFNTTHNHAGPSLTHWSYSRQPDSTYIDWLETIFTEICVAAMEKTSEVTISAGSGHTDLPLSRRKVDSKGLAEWKPSNVGPTCNALPVCVLRKTDGSIFSVLFSASCHPSTWYKAEISADYPGVAVDLLNKHFGIKNAIFLQGCGGDSKPRHIADGENRWISNTDFKYVEAAGKSLADDVINTIQNNMEEFTPKLDYATSDIPFELCDAPSEMELNETTDNNLMNLWKEDMLSKLEMFGTLPATVPVCMHFLQIAEGVSFLGLEAEATAEIGNLILEASKDEVVFPLGYTNGTQIYLPCDRQLPEKGYEVISFWEYHWPSQLAPGIDKRLKAAIKQVTG